MKILKYTGMFVFVFAMSVGVMCATDYLMHLVIGWDKSTLGYITTASYYFAGGFTAGKYTSERPA